MVTRAVLFDLDGTLLNTLEDLADSMNAVLERHGHPTHPMEPYKVFVGGGEDSVCGDEMRALEAAGLRGPQIPDSGEKAQLTCMNIPVVMENVA